MNAKEFEIFEKLVESYKHNIENLYGCFGEYQLDKSIESGCPKCNEHGHFCKQVTQILQKHKGKK